MTELKLLTLNPVTDAAPTLAWLPPEPRGPLDTVRAPAETVNRRVGHRR